MHLLEAFLCAHAATGEAWLAISDCHPSEGAS
jgi:hypothetical protein